MDWLRRHRLIAIAIILGIGMMGADALIHVVSYRHGDRLAELSGLQALELGMLISFLVLPIVFGLYAHSLLQRAQLAAGTVRGSEQFLNALMSRRNHYRQDPLHRLRQPGFHYAHRLYNTQVALLFFDLDGGFKDINDTHWDTPSVMPCCRR